MAFIGAFCTTHEESLPGQQSFASRQLPAEATATQAKNTNHPTIITNTRAEVARVVSAARLTWPKSVDRMSQRARAIAHRGVGVTANCDTFHPDLLQQHTIINDHD